MKISSIIDIIKGKLLNTPSISFITQAHTNINKINDGDLFISSSKNEIELAIKQGAFAIIHDTKIDILDSEIAWIKVDDIYDACLKLIRFHLSSFNINSLIVNEIAFEIFDIFKTKDNQYIYLDNDILNNFELIKNSHNLKNIISTNELFLKSIYPNSKYFKIGIHSLDNLIVHSLFETSFSYKENYFYKLKLPMIYIDTFLSVKKHLNILDFDNSKLKNFNYMKAIFISNSLQIVDFGKSNRFIIANNKKSTNYLEIAFLKKFYNYGKIKIIDTKENHKILKILKNNDYNAIYITSRTNLEINNLLLDNQLQNIKLF